MELAKRGGRQSGPERARGGGELALAGAPAQRIARAAELPHQRLDRGPDPVAAGAHGAPLERLLHQWLGREAAGPGRVDQMLHTGGGDGIQPFGEPPILRLESGGDSGEQAEEHDQASRGAHGQLTVRTDTGVPKSVWGAGGSLGSRTQCRWSTRKV